MAPADRPLPACGLEAETDPEWEATDLVLVDSPALAIIPPNFGVIGMLCSLSTVWPRPACRPVQVCWGNGPGLDITPVPAVMPWLAGIPRFISGFWGVKPAGLDIIPELPLSIPELVAIIPGPAPIIPELTLTSPEPKDAIPVLAGMRPTFPPIIPGLGPTLVGLTAITPAPAAVSPGLASSWPAGGPMSPEVLDGIVPRPAGGLVNTPPPFTVIPPVPTGVETALLELPVGRST